ncbi:MAG: glycosyltransferase family 4 protein [Candidatus Omnitrophota bacterium]
MNILLLANHMNVGGIANYCFFLGSALKKRGHRVFLACAPAACEGEQANFAKFSRAGIIHIEIPIRTKSALSPRVFLSLAKLAPEIGRRRIDILHANTRVTQVLAAGLKNITGRPYLSTCHGFFKPRFLRRVLPFSGSRVIAVSVQVKEHLVRDLCIKPEMIRLVPNGIDSDFFSPGLRRSSEKSARSDLRQSLGLPEGRIIGTIGRLSDVKGHLYFIEAMPDISRAFPGAAFLIVGEGRMKEAIVARARERGVLNKLYLRDSVSDTRQALWAMDVFVMPSLSEGLGLSLMEAMSCALPAVGSDVGGIRTLIRHGDNGLLVKPADPPALAAAVKTLLADEQMMSVMGARAREYIRSGFSLEGMAAGTEEVYKECLFG